MVHFERAEAGAGGRWRARWRQLRDTAEAGMSTAEYAVGTVAAVLYRVVTGDSIVSALDALVDRALTTLS